MKKKSSRENSLSINSRQRIMNTKSFASTNFQSNDEKEKLSQPKLVERTSKSPSYMDKKNKDTEVCSSTNSAELPLCQDNQFSLININQVHTYTVGRCGYCQNTKWNTSGFDCAQMSLKDYQLLMDRGWRRCGTYFYKPHVDFCCCRTFSIRINAAEYKQGNSQKKVVKKFEKMLNKQDEKTEYLKKVGFYRDGIENEQNKKLQNMYDGYDEEDEDDDCEDEDDEDLLIQNTINQQNGRSSLQNQISKQNSQKQLNSAGPSSGSKSKNNSRNNSRNGSISNRSSQIKEGHSLSQFFVQNSSENKLENQSQTKRQNFVREKSLTKENQIILEQDESINQTNYLSQIDQELMNEIKDRAWQILRLCLENIKKNLTPFLDTLGLPEDEKTQNIIFDDRIMDQSRLYQNKNMMKHGTHSTNFLITFYRLNMQAWGEYFKTKEKFFLKSYSYFEKVFEYANKELAKKNIKLNLRTCGEINVFYMKRSFLKRVQEVNILRSKSKSLINKNDPSQDIFIQQDTPIIRNPAIPKKKKSSFVIPDKRKDFHTKIVRAEFDEQSYELYKRYNKIIHNNMKTSKESYKNFLCLNGLRGKSIENRKGKVLNYGCYHFKYFLDKILIAVSVVDILPEGLSSVYYFYEPDLKKYSLGVIGNLRDIDYIKEMNIYFPNFRYYYLGYYIHNNSKMSYKASYKPFELLCPITYRWVVYEKVTQDSIKDGEEVPRLCLNEKIIEDMDFLDIDIEKYVQQKVKLYISGRYIKINQIKQSFITYFQFLLSKLVTLLGKQLSESLVFGQQ